jgi:hypothetical protein
MTARGAGGLLKRSKSTFQDIKAPPCLDKTRMEQYVEALLKIDGRGGQN